MRVADRIAKLRRMAEHPTSNPHEAAIAREEMERLLRANPSAEENSWLHVGHSKNTDEFMWRYADMIRRDRERGIYHGPRVAAPRPWETNEREYRARIGMWRAQQGYRPINWETEGSPTNRPPLAWSQSLMIGSTARTAFSVSPLIYNGPPLKSSIVTVERMTRTQYVMKDGSRYRRTGNSAGYKVGESGSDGHRTYLVRP